MKFLLRLLKGFLRCKADNNVVSLALPNTVESQEDLARNLIGGNKPKDIKKKLFDPVTEEIKPSRFLDSRNPREISINRISTLTELQAHRLGCDHRDEINRNNPGNQPQTYHGFAKLKAEMCMKVGCKVIPDTYAGTKPYHGNIIYPKDQKQDDMEIAVELALKAKLIKYVGS
jgi:hypothetical protein